MQKRKDEPQKSARALIAELRARGLSDREIAGRTGTSTSTICRLRTGTTTDTTAATYLKLLGLYNG